MLFNNGKIGKKIYVMTKGLFSSEVPDISRNLFFLRSIIRKSSNGNYRVGANGNYRVSPVININEESI